MQPHIWMSTKQSSIDKPIIPINKPWLAEEEKNEIMSVLRENTLTSAAKDGGKRVRGFEALLKDYLHVKHALAVNSGTSALHASLLAAGIGKGDEVLLPSFTFVATANSVIATGARPVFVDINKHDYTINIENLRAKITNNSKAIIPVHLYGIPCDMDEIAEVADKQSIVIIEDACQSLGSTYRNRQTGTFGSLGCYSLYASKVLTSGEGGAVVTNDDNLADKIKMIRNHGMVEGYDSRIFGLNLRLPELSAALAIAQMKKLNKLLELRKRNAELLTSLISSYANSNEIVLPHENQDKRFNWYLYTIAFAKNDIRDIVQKRMLSTDNVGATVYYDPPVHKTPYYERMLASESNPPTKDSLSLANTEWASKHVLSLPVHPLVTPEDLKRVASSIKGAS
jgi:perosamine synthetase